MAYSDDINALSPDHKWDFDGDLIDSVSAANGTGTSIDFPTTPICLGVTASARTNATSDNISVADQTDINSAGLSQFYIGGWIQISDKQGPPVCVWKAGGTTNRGIFTGVNNNNLVFQHDNGTANVQNYSDFALASNRNYYVAMRFDNGICDAFIDGIKQSTSDPSDGDIGTTSFAAHTGGIDWGDAGSPTIGGLAILAKALVNCLYNEWHTFSGANIPSDLEIREELFEKGAIPDTIITSGTEALMQISIDAEADTVGPNVECDLEIQAVIGDGDLTLTLDNRTFNPRTSIHIRYLGTGTLTVVNTNGANASIGSTPNGGTIIFATEVTVKITCKDATTGAAIENARVYVLDSSDNVILNDLTNASGILSGTYNYIANDTLSSKSKARKGSASPYYKTAPITGTITNNGLDTTVLMINDE